MQNSSFQILLVLIFIALFAGSCINNANYTTENQKNTYKNPVIPGFHPDPSVCRTGEDYYLVNSSFEWFPGIPIFHSKDLVNWKQIGHVLDRKSQLNMINTSPSAGIWAPTIRYYDGWYYVVVTCKQCRNDCNCGFNFYVKSKNPEVPWSDPVYIKGAPGIDPEIFGDENGKTYYLGSTHDIGGPRRWPAEDRIYIQEIDLETGEPLEKPVILTSGHATNAKYAEGPHLYKINGRYLLIVAEGGTWNMHAVTAFESDSIYGPYIPLHSNPVLTHRHLGRKEIPSVSEGGSTPAISQKVGIISQIISKNKYDIHRFILFRFLFRSFTGHCKKQNYYEYYLQQY